MKKALYLSLGLAGVLCAPDLFASASNAFASSFEDQENIRPTRQKVLIEGDHHKKVVLNHHFSRAADAARVMHDHALIKRDRLNAKVAAAIKAGEADVSALQARLLGHDAEVERLRAQKEAVHTGAHTGKLKKLSNGPARKERVGALKAGGTAAVGKIDLTAGQKIFDQGQLGSCTAHGTTACLKQAGLTTDPSRLFIYLAARSNMGALEGNPSKYIKQDSGAAIANAAIGATHYAGIVPESTWPYNDSTKKGLFSTGTAPFMQQPGLESYHAGTDLESKVQLSFAKVGTSTAAIIERLQAGRYVVFGITLQNSFMNVGSDGVVPLPGDTRHDPIAGGHCMAVGGYLPNMKGDGVDYFKVQNSWSTSWGDKGFCYMPVKMFENDDTLGDLWYVSGGTKPAATTVATTEVAS
ncbi:MAG: hypothetical protein C0514_07480 [Candidatus Puniceispirillum sp.]|nr:hypothetical protein [Candidatus Puniceispirillum sp.]